MRKYLYNGVELLDINTAWTDHETYPYAILYEDGGDFRLTYSNQSTVYRDGKIAYVGGTTYVSYLYMKQFPDGMTEEEFEEMVGLDAKLNEWFFFEESTLSSSTTVKLGATPFWASYDVLDDNGVVCFEGSTPIPLSTASRIIMGDMVGAFAITPKSFVLEDESGTSLMAVAVGEETVLTANAKTDIRAGVVAATEEGVVTGEATIPNYETVTGKKVIMPNSAFTIELPNSYDYTEIQCIICQFNTSFDDSVASTRVVIGDNVYDSGSTVVVATLTKNADKKSIDFNLTNTSDTTYMLRYFTYRELY